MGQTKRTNEWYELFDESYKQQKELKLQLDRYSDKKTQPIKTDKK